MKDLRHTPSTGRLVMIIVTSVLCVFMAQIAIQNASQSSRLARQNVTINRLAGSVDQLTSQLNRRGSISQHVTCTDAQSKIFTATGTSFLDSLGAGNEVATDFWRTAFHNASNAVLAGLDNNTPASNPNACPVLPPK